MITAPLLCKGFVSVLTHHFEATVLKGRVRHMKVGAWSTERCACCRRSLPSRSVMFIRVIDSKGLIPGGVFIRRFSHLTVSVVRVGLRLVSETTTFDPQR